MTKGADRSVIPISPTTLSSFISIAQSDLRDPRERRLVSLLLWGSAGLILLATLPTSYRFSFLGAGALVICLVALSTYFQVQVTNDPGRKITLAHLFRFLNYNRAKEGLDVVIGSDMLSILEGEAQIWEQIESGLQSELWRAQESLRERIQRRADQAMVELIALGASTSSVQEYTSWHVAWDTNTARLRHLLAAMYQAERILFIYPRASDLSAEAPIPETSEIDALEKLLSDWEN